MRQSFADAWCQLGARHVPDFSELLARYSEPGRAHYTAPTLFKAQADASRLPNGPTERIVERLEAQARTNLSRALRALRSVDRTGGALMETSRVATTRNRLVGYTMLVVLAAGIFWFLWHHPWETVATILLAPLSYFPLAMGLFPGVWRRSSDKLPAAEADLERRRTVWGVLSELYLDTELDERDNERIAGVLVASGYGAGQLEEILYRELHPVLHANLLSVAGEWAGFDLEWLEEQIRRRGPRRSSVAVIPGKWMVRGSWEAIEAKLRGTRA